MDSSPATEKGEGGTSDGKSFLLYASSTAFSNAAELRSFLKAEWQADACYSNQWAWLTKERYYIAKKRTCKMAKALCH